MCIESITVHAAETVFVRYSEKSLVLISHQPTGDLFQWVPGASAMDRRRTRIWAKCKLFWRNFHAIISPQIWIESSYWSTLRPQTDDVHKLFSSSTTAGLPGKLNSAPLRRQAGVQCLAGQVYYSAINVHICSNGVLSRPRYVGDIREPGLPDLIFNAPS